MSQDLISLKDAIAFGEFKPEILAKYPEWEKLSNYARFQMISQGLENRRKQIYKKWTEVVNFIGDDPTTDRQETKENLERQMQTLRADKERLYNEYSKLT